jgi:hypothetical protein
MPAALTHYLFGIKNLDPSLDESSFLLGCQGPDPFFFMGMVPWIKDKDAKAIRDYGEYLHHHDFASVYAKMLCFALLKENEEKTTLVSYLKGLWGHYCLDRSCHPYIFYRSGFDENGSLTGHFGYSHKVFEALMDATLSRNFHLPSAKKALAISKAKKEAISLMWAFASPLLSPSSFSLSLSSYATVEGFLQSKTGIKRILWKALGKENVLYAFSYPHSLKKKEGLDVLNKKKAVWLNPVSGEKSDLSVEEMFDKAASLYHLGEGFFDSGLSEEEIASGLSKLEGRVDHDGCLFLGKKAFKDANSPF